MAESGTSERVGEAGAHESTVCSQASRYQAQHYWSGIAHRQWIGNSDLIVIRFYAIAWGFLRPITA